MAPKDNTHLTAFAFAGLLFTKSKSNDSFLTKRPHGILHIHAGGRTSISQQSLSASGLRMAADGADVKVPLKTGSKTETTIRPRSVKSFSIPYDNLVIRAWRPGDRVPCIELIGSVLTEYRLSWDPLTADRDVVDVENTYREGEFWVIEDTTTSNVVGTAAFYAVPHRGSGCVEIRKMYISKAVRGRGLGAFLLTALEQRAYQLGYKKAFIETASVLKEAHAMYLSRGYIPSSGLETERCDIVLQKALLPLQPPINVDHVEAIDMTRGWMVTCTTRKQALDHRILFRAVVVLVESGDKVLVHKRSQKKSTYPGRLAVFVTGGVDWMEEPLASAKREVQEEIGISGLQFSQVFAPFLAKGKDGLGQRIQFHPFVARGDFSEEDLVFDPEEVESGELLSREEIISKGIGGSLWEEFRGHGL